MQTTSSHHNVYIASVMKKETMSIDSEGNDNKTNDFAVRI